MTNPGLLSSGKVDELDPHSGRSFLVAELSMSDPAADNELGAGGDTHGDPHLFAGIEKDIGAHIYTPRSEVERLENDWFSQLVKEAHFLN